MKISDVLTYIFTMLLAAFAFAYTYHFLSDGLSQIPIWVLVVALALFGISGFFAQSAKNFMGIKIGVVITLFGLFTLFFIKNMPLSPGTSPFDMVFVRILLAFPYLPIFGGVISMVYSFNFFVSRKSAS